MYPDYIEKMKTLPPLTTVPQSAPAVREP
jgi:hypothetical protein